MGKKITIFLFIITIFSLSVVTLFGKNKTFSEIENRTLSGKPELSVEKIASGEFADNLEVYLSDQLFLKEHFVMLKNESELIAGKDKLGEVYLSDDGRYIRNFVENTSQIEKNILFINKSLEKNGISKDRVFFVLIPTASYVYNDKLPKTNLSDSEENTFKVVEENLKNTARFISLKDVFNDVKDENIYYNTDHHWTMLGAYYGYEYLMESLGKEVRPLSDFKEVKLDEKFYGSLYSQAPLFFTKADEVVFYDYKNLNYTIEYVKEGEKRDSFLVEEKFEVKDKYTALFGGNYGRMIITNHDNSEGEKLIIFKDSYTNSILPYLIGDYSVIEVVDLRYSSPMAGFFKDKEDYKVMFIYNADFINTDNSFVKLYNY